MSIKAPGYNVSTGPAAGFVKNDASGNFLFGQAGGGGGGGGGAGGAWELVEGKEITAAATTVSFTGLNGDADDTYMLVYRLRKLNASASPNVVYRLRPNGLSTNQRSVEQITVYPTGNTTSNTRSEIRLGSGGSVAFDGDFFGVMLIDAETGNRGRRFLDSRTQDFLTGFGTFSVWNNSSVWTDSTTNITSLDIVASEANTIEVGSQFYLYKLQKSAAAGGGLELIETKDVSVATNSLTFSGLNGDSDDIYKLFFDYTGPGVFTNYDIRPNGVTTAQNTVRHRFNYVGTHQISTFPGVMRFAQTQTGDASGELTLHAKSGKRRIFRATRNFGSTGSGPVGERNYAGHWDETTTNITSLVIVSSTASGITAGSKWSLYKVNR